MDPERCLLEAVNKLPSDAADPHKFGAEQHQVEAGHRVQVATEHVADVVFGSGNKFAVHLDLAVGQTRKQVQDEPRPEVLERDHFAVSDQPRVLVIDWPVEHCDNFK